jgi:hypothetical protein
MRNRCRAQSVLLALAIVLGTRPALAQSGSTGGSIGDDDKSISGTRERSSSPPDVSRPSSKPSGSDGSNPFDGRWAFTTTGCTGAGTIMAIIRGGHFVTPISHGDVSPNGEFHAVGGGIGLTFTATGHMGEASGGGTFRRSDGCNGRWSAVRS